MSLGNVSMLRSELHTECVGVGGRGWGDCCPRMLDTPQPTRALWSPALIRAWHLGSSQGLHRMIEMFYILIWGMATHTSETTRLNAPGVCSLLHINSE